MKPVPSIERASSPGRPGAASHVKRQALEVHA